MIFCGIIIIALSLCADAYGERTLNLAMGHNNGRNNIEAKKLTLVGHFPTEKEEVQGVYLAKPAALAEVHHGNLYVADNGARDIKVFQPTGKYLFKFGAGGQGPGEFEGPRKIMNSGSKIIVFDSRRFMLQYFSLDGRYERGVKLLQPYSDIAVNEKGLIIAARMPRRPVAHLVDVLDEQGALLYSFGNPVSISGIQESYINQVQLDIDEQGNVLVIFMTIALLRKYGINGRLLNESKFEDSPGKAINKEENDNLKNLRRASVERSPYRRLFDEVKSNNRYVYALRNLRDCLQIIELDDSLAIRNVYEYPVPGNYNYLAADLVVINKDSRVFFYALQVFPSVRIDILVAAEPH
jgi:6-bladed beta-propeller